MSARSTCFVHPRTAWERGLVPPGLIFAGQVFSRKKCSSLLALRERIHHCPTPPGQQTLPAPMLSRKFPCICFAQNLYSSPASICKRHKIGDKQLMYVTVAALCRMRRWVEIMTRPSAHPLGEKILRAPYCCTFGKYPKHEKTDFCAGVPVSHLLCSISQRDFLQCATKPRRTVRRYIATGS